MKRIIKNKQLDLLIKLLVVALLAWSIYRQVFAKEDAAAMWQAFRGCFSGWNTGWLFAVLLLVPVNWGLETQKWRVLMGRFVEIGFWRGFKAVLAGVTISLFTPNRIGEYGGRLLLVEARHNWKAVIATLVGSFSQLLILLTCGWLGLLYFSQHFLSLDPATFSLVSIGSVAAIGAMWLGFFNIGRLGRWTRRYRWLKPLRALARYRNMELVRALLFSFGRYATYSFQYFLMLHFYGIEVSLGVAMAGIATIFFLQASVPLPPLLGLLARGELALYIWGSFSDQDLHILACTFTLFIINLSVPALLGAAFIVQTNVMKSLGYENGKSDV